MQAKDIMANDVVTVGSGHSVVHAAQIMLDHGVSGLPVVDDGGTLIGMLSEGDLMRRSELGSGFLVDVTDAQATDRSSEYVQSHSWRVSDVMSHKVISIPPDCSVEHIADLLERNGIKRIPVVQNEQLIGIVSRADLLRAIVSTPLEPVIRGDNALRLAIKTRLVVDAGLETFEIDVQVEDGHVTLSGEVETINQLEAARVAAESVRGSKSVANEIMLSSRISGNGD